MPHSYVCSSSSRKTRLRYVNHQNQLILCSQGFLLIYDVFDYTYL